MSNEIRKQVERPHAHDGIGTARNMSDAANAEQSLQGYASVNGLSEDSDIARRAYENFEKRLKEGIEGSPDGDWFTAEQEILRGRSNTDM